MMELSETGASDVQGALVGTKYGLQPIQYLKDLVDAAKNQHFFIGFATIIRAPEGVHDVVIPKKSKYEGRSGMDFDETERTAADITWTTMDNLTSVIVTPVPKLAGYALTNYALRTNAVNLLNNAKEELSYAIGDKLDQAVAVALGDATAATSSAAGAQLLFGGDAVSDATLTAADTITTDLLAKAARYLKTLVCKYWSAGVEGTSSATKNPWQNTADEPFVFFMGPAQEEVFRTDSQFVNASEYGDVRVIRNGEIGELGYLGIKLVVTNNVESVAAGVTGPDGTTTAVAMTRCVLMKARKAVAVVWGQDPTIKVFDYPNRDQTRISLVCAYAIKVIHDDSIVWIDVAGA